MNTGIDEILFIEKVISSSLQTTLGTSNSRIAMQFDLTDISESIANGNISSSSDIQFYLNLYTTKADSIPYQYTIVATPLSQSWDMGIGRTTHLPITKEGASWTYRFGYSDANAWTTAGGSTSSAYPIHTQSFTFESTDVRMNVSSSVASWLSSDIPNNGLLIMRSQSQELDNNQYGSLKFFSKDTHTVYLPKLEIAWDDSTFITGSLTALTADNIILYLKDNSYNFKESSKAKFRIVGRETYPAKTYTTSSNQLLVKYIPSSSYYSVKDAQTEDTIIPFDDNYTKISCDSSGNYINLWLNGFQPERYYRLIFKITDRQYNGQVELFDNDYIFKVTR